MPTTLTASFDTRRDAEMTVERLVQEQGIDRSAIDVATASDANSAGEDRAGSDEKAGSPSPEARNDAALNGKITVSVAVDDSRVAAVKEAFAEFDADDVAAG